MRIAYLVNQYPKISHTFIRREISALERLGHEIDRIAVRGWADQLVDCEDVKERDRTHYILLEKRTKLLSAMLKTLLSRPWLFSRALVAMLQLARGADRSLLHHCAYFLEACYLAARFRATPVDHLHVHFGTNSAAVALLTRLLGGPRWSFTIHGPEEFDKAATIKLKYKIEHCAFAVAVSSFGRSQLMRHASHSSWSKLHVVHCGLDVSVLDANPSNTQITSSLRLVCIGRLSEQKGQLLLIDAARTLYQQKYKFELVLVGDGELRKEIETLVERYGLRDVVRLTGWMSGEEVRNELSNARAMVLPSFAEGLPVVIMEAMAQHVPVISTYIAGIPELVSAPDCGWLIPAGDTEALSKAMSDCLKAPRDTLLAKGAASFSRVSERHNINVEATKLANLFAQASRG